MDREKFLHDLRVYGVENTVPNISDVNAKFLRDLLKISKSEQVLEIGTANGFSSIQLWIELEKVGGKLLTIDFSPKSHEEAKENIKQANLENTVEAVFGNALDVIPTLEDDYYDFVFIDGMMRRSKDFLDLCLPKTKSGWIIIIDDVIKFRDKMVWLWEYLEENNISYNTLPLDEDDGIMMIIKEF